VATTKAILEVEKSYSETEYKSSKERGWKGGALIQEGGESEAIGAKQPRPGLRKLHKTGALRNGGKVLKGAGRKDEEGKRLGEGWVLPPKRSKARRRGSRDGFTVN